MQPRSELADERPRLDILVRDLREVLPLVFLTEEERATITAAADELEARIASPHIDAKHWAQLSRLRVAHKKLVADYNEALAREADLRAQVALANTPVTDEAVAEAVREFFQPEHAGTYPQMHAALEAARRVVSDAD